MNDCNVEEDEEKVQDIPVWNILGVCGELDCLYYISCINDSCYDFK